MKFNKINKAVVTVFFSIASFTSCHDILDIIPEGQLTLDEIFANEVTTGAYLNTCYSDFPNYGYSYAWRSNLPIILSDDAWEFATATNSVANAYKGMTSTKWSNWVISDNSMWGKRSNSPSTSWDLFYRNIKKCNVFLSRIDDAVVPSETDPKAWKAEIRTLRAYYYWELMTRFGDVPLITNVPAATDDGSNLKRNKFKEVAEFVIAECDAVIAEPSFPWFTLLEEDKRMNKAVAAMLKSRAALFLASPLFNSGENYWEMAEKATKEALEACLEGGLELYTEVRNPSIYGDNAYREFITSTKDYSQNPVDKETILIAGDYMGGNNSMKQNGIPQNKASKAGSCPTQELVDAYPMADGSYILDILNPYNDEKHLEPNFNTASSYDEQNPYEGRDPRFYANILYNGSTVLNSKKQPITIETFKGGKDGIMMGNIVYTCTGYYPGKYLRPDGYPGSWTRVHFRTMRLAELYLNYAEAAAENNNIEAAVAAILPIRERVGMPNISPSNQEEAIAMIRNERRIEFAFEENRYNDIRRYTKSGEDESFTKHLTAMWIEKVGNEFEYRRVPIGQVYNSESDKIEGNPWTRETYKAKYMLHGLEDVECTKLEAITGDKWQNPGWE